PGAAVRGARATTRRMAVPGAGRRTAGSAQAPCGDIPIGERRSGRALVDERRPTPTVPRTAGGARGDAPNYRAQGARGNVRAGPRLARGRATVRDRALARSRRVP